MIKDRFPEHGEFEASMADSSSRLYEFYNDRLCDPESTEEPIVDLFDVEINVTPNFMFDSMVGYSALAEKYFIVCSHAERRGGEYDVFDVSISLEQMVRPRTELAKEYEENNQKIGEALGSMIMVVGFTYNPANFETTGAVEDPFLTRRNGEVLTNSDASNRHTVAAFSFVAETMEEFKSTSSYLTD